MTELGNPASPTEGLSSGQQTMVLVVATVAGFLSSFMSSSVNIALPVIGAEFHITAVVLGWIPLAYILTSGAGLMPAGQLADVFGRMRVFRCGMVTFMVFCAACALAPSASWLIAFRLLQGVGAAMLFSTTTAMVTAAFPPEKRGGALGLQISGVYLGLTLGPALGGILTHNVGWRGMFWIVGALALGNYILAAAKTRGIEWRPAERVRFDKIGSLIFVVALPVFLIGLSLLPTVLGITLAVVGLVGLAGFIWWEGRVTSPILRIDLFRHNQTFALSNISCFINYAATFAMTFLISLYLEYVRGLNAQTAGLVLVAGLLVQALFSSVAGRLVDRVSARLVASAGMSVCVLGLLGLAFLTTTTPYWQLIPLLCVLGLGFAFFAPAITHAVMGSVRDRDLSVASATLATMRNLGQNISQVIATLVLAGVVGRHEIGPNDYPRVLTSVRITFGIFAGLCVVGLVTSLLGVRPSRQEE